MIADLRENIQKLIALYEAEKEKNTILQRRLDESLSSEEALAQQITELKRQIDNLTLSQAFSSPGGNNVAAKEKIERLIKEIDKCISLIEK